MCDCGNAKNIQTGHLKSGNTNSCGCLRKDVSNKEIAGQRYGLLTAIKATSKRANNRGVIWRCLCDCGNAVDIVQSSLSAKRSLSCGCVKSVSIMKQKTQVKNKSRHRGVNWHKKANKWIAQICHDYKQYYLGSFSTLEEAIQARQTAEEQILKGEFSIDRTRNPEPNPDSTLETRDDLPY
jgi:hypothetical protein